MWTNIFRIGDLQVVSWFQLLPCEFDVNSISEKSLKAAQKDAATHMVLSAHLRLQQEGFLSSWTNSFVGPWDPSQGVHNPDERVKLWLFLPGRHSSIIETAQVAISKLRVVGNGIWLAPGDSEEVAVALSQALRNSIERALKGLSYIRFGDAFTRCHSYTQSERNYRRAQPTFEFVFAATEEAIYVHAVISAKHIRGLCSDDMERVLRHRTSSSNWEGLPVIVAPNGMQGRLTGCCPSDLVKQVYMSEHRSPNGLSVGNPFHGQRSSGCKLRGQSCYAEVTLGCASAHCDKSLESNGSNSKDTIHPDAEELQTSVGMTQPKQGLTDRFPILERSFFHPAETVLVPLMHRAFASSSLKRFWLQNAVGTSPFELWPLWNLSASSHIEHCFDSMEGLVFEVDGMQARYNSSSNSNSSSISSISSTSGESDLATSFGGADFDADADSLTCRQSGLSSNDQFEHDGPKKVSKRPRASTTETYGLEGTVINADIQDPYKSENCGVANSNTAGATNIQVNPHWDWDDEDRSMGDIQILLSEFGEFGDFFEDDDLEFGEEQRRRGFSCGPFMVHAGCGGLLATCHYVDIAGVDLIDPLSAEVQVSSATSLLHSDIKVALKAAFGNLDGPLSVIDWCKGRSQPGDSVAMADAYSFQCTVGEAKDSTINLVGEPISPPQSSGGSCGTREGARIDESTQRRSNQEICIAESEQGKSYPRFRPTLLALPLPAILVGYQDDWLKTSANCLQLWEKAPLEPYAQPKPVNYYALCPDIDLLSFAAADFFQQLGTVYEACKLGSHSPQMMGGQVEIFSGKCLPSGLVLVDCPDQLKVAGNNIRSISSTSDFLQALSKGWSVKSYVKNLTKVIKDLKIVSTSSVNQKEISTGPSTVVYVVCPFPEPTAVLETLVECSAALGSVFLSPEKERRSLLYSQVAKALKCIPAVDETAASNVLTLSGFNVPKLVMQIVTVESLLRINKPVSELAILKDIAFTVYSKVRRFPRAASTVDLLQSSTLSGRSQSTLMHATSSVPGLWKDCLTPRISGSALSRENELDAALRTNTWDNSWQTSRPAGLNGDPNRPVEVSCQDEVRYVFEPLFVLAEPGSVEHGISPAVFGSSALDSSSSKSFSDDNSGIYMQNSTLGGSTDIGMGSLIDGPEHEHRTSSLHCSYGWTEDWRWLVCIWTDSRGELLDSNIFPFGGISSRQDTKVLQNLFVQVLYQGCQILSCASSDSGVVRPRGIVISRIGCFFELECQEWQKAIYSIGGNEVKKWPLQLRRSLPDGISSSANGTSLQQQDMGLIQERNLPSSPSPPFYGSHTKSSFMKGGLGQTNSKKQLLPGHSGMGSSRGLLNLVQSISLIGVSIDHSLHLILPADMSSGGGTQSSSSSGVSSYLEGFSPVKSVASTPASYLLIPSPSLRYLPPTPMQLPTCLTSESPPLAHLLHSKGSAIPLATGYVVSKAVPAMKKDLADPTKEDWPSILAVSLVDHYGSHNMVRGAGASSGNKQRSLGTETTSRDQEVERRLVLESVAAELHSLSWMTVSPVYPERRTALPFHCDMLLRLRRLLHYADKVLTRPPENVHQG